MSGCADWQTDLSAYLDGELAAERRRDVAAHLEACAACSGRAGQWRALGSGLQSLQPPPAPRNMALRLRVAASHYSTRHWQVEFWEMRLQAWCRSLAVPVLAGMMGALCIFALMFGPVGHTAMAAAAVADVPLPLSSPPRLVNPMPLGISSPLLIVADVDSLGRVDGYRVLSGPHDPALITRLNNALLMTVFAPATILGQPTPGQVLLSFDTVTVRVRG